MLRGFERIQIFTTLIISENGRKLETTMVPQRLRDRKASRKRQIWQSICRQRTQGFNFLKKFQIPKMF